tara:strand:- start:787 stop:1347 length:561 start_codon:yes stop_codon:yes gene_type:complete
MATVNISVENAGGNPSKISVSQQAVKTNIVVSKAIVGSSGVTSVDLTAGTGIAVSGGPVTTTGSITVGVTGVLEDLMTLGPPSADGQFAVGTGAGAFAYESGATARTSLGLSAAAIVYSAEHTSSSGVIEIETNTHGISTPGAVVQVYDENFNFSLAEIQQESDKVTISVNTDGTYKIVITGKHQA